MFGLHRWAAVHAVGPSACSFDGVVVLFRVALAMIKLHEKQLLSIVDESEMLEAIKSIPSRCADTRVRAMPTLRGAGVEW
jgi:hypothetical protein